MKENNHKPKREWWKLLIILTFILSLVAVFFSLFTIQTIEKPRYQDHVIKITYDKPFDLYNLYEIKGKIVKNITCTEEVKGRIYDDPYSLYYNYFYVYENETGMCVYITKEVKTEYHINIRWLQ